MGIEQMCDGFYLLKRLFTLFYPSTFLPFLFEKVGKADMLFWFLLLMLLLLT